LAYFHRKWMIIGSVLLLASGIVGAIFIPPVVFRHKFQNAMEALLKTQVEVGSAEISLLLKKGTIHDLTIHNPEGYADQPFLVIPKITFEMGPPDSASGTARLKSIVLHDPVMYLETSGETSNLKDAMALMMIPSGEPTPPVIIESLVISNGTIASYPDHTGHQFTSPFPIEEVRDLEGRPGQIANRIAKELQTAMDTNMKETVKSLKQDFIKGFSDLFGL
jgi:hypothetical protein